eukprot:COSAG02_NODE_38522_length_428_cov_0.772036_1_plen_82_part_01
MPSFALDFSYAHGGAQFKYEQRHWKSVCNRWTLVHAWSGRFPGEKTQPEASKSSMKSRRSRRDFLVLVGSYRARAPRPRRPR